MRITDDAKERLEQLEGKFQEVQLSTKEVISKFKADRLNLKHKISREAKEALRPYLTPNFWRKDDEKTSV